VEPNGSRWRRIAPLNRRLDRLGLYSRIIYNFSIHRFPRHKPLISMAAINRWSRVFYSRTEQPTTPGQSIATFLGNGFRLTERRPAAIAASNARLQNSMSQRARSRPTHGGTSDFPSHGFQIFHFNRATLALPKVLLAGQRIWRVQFSVEKSVEHELPIRTGTGRTRAACGRRRPDHCHAYHVAEPERQPAAGLTMTLPFLFGWIEHKYL
jgi:hypothetical protein